MTNEVKNVPELRFLGFKEKWVEKKLGDIGKVSMNKRIYKHETSIHNEIPFYKIGSFGGKADTFITKRKFEEYKEKYPYPKKGDILISASGSIGKTIEYNGEQAYYQDSNIVWLEHNNEVLNIFLKYYYLIIKWSGVEGTTIKRLYNKNILSTKINFPEISEQQKIGDFFSKLDRQIELEEQKLEKLEQQKKGYMQKIFSQQLRFKDEYGNDYPDWEEKKIENVFEATKGFGLSKDHIDNEGEYDCLLYGELYTHYGEKITNTISKTNVFEGREGKYNDLLFPNSTTTNAWDLATFSSLRKNNVLLGGDITILRPINNDINSLFYAYYLTNYFNIRKKISKFGQGITIVHLTFKNFKDVNIIKPLLKEQNDICNFLENIESLIELHINKVKCLKNRKQAFLQKMFI